MYVHHNQSHSINCQATEKNLTASLANVSGNVILNTNRAHIVSHSHLGLLRGDPGHAPVGQRQPQPGQHPGHLIVGRLVEDLVKNRDLSGSEEHTLVPQAERLGRHLQQQ